MAERASLFMESTEIEASKTIAQITSALVAAGARSISMQYEPGGKMTGLQFAFQVGPGLVHFALPARVDPVFKILNGRRKYQSDRTSNEPKDRAQADRVAWRQLLRWIEAQIAMIDTGMAKTEEVFMPYLKSPATGRTMFEEFEESHLRMIASPEKEVA